MPPLYYKTPASRCSSPQMKTLISKREKGGFGTRPYVRVFSFCNDACVSAAPFHADNAESAYTP